MEMAFPFQHPSITSEKSHTTQGQEKWSKNDIYQLPRDSQDGAGDSFIVIHSTNEIGEIAPELEKGKFLIISVTVSRQKYSTMG